MTAPDPNLDAAAFASPNFAHLARTAPHLAGLAAHAERFAFEDPVTALFKLRQFGEGLAQETAAHVGLYTTPREFQAPLLRRLKEAAVIDHEVAELFDALRTTGNRAVHENQGTRRDALHMLQIAWKLGIWFQRAFNDPQFKLGAFIPPPDPREAEYALHAELAELRRTAIDHETRLADLRATAEQEAERRAQAEARSQQAYDDLATALALTRETEARAARLEAEFQAHLADLQAQATAAPKATLDAVVHQIQTATRQLPLSEAETRLLIDAQLRAAGWEADTTALSYKAGARPAPGRHLAIAEWPTASGPADYVLFAGLTPIAIIEAKRQTKDVVGAIEQARRYSRGYTFTGEHPAPGAPWGTHNIPFLFATNGRPYLRQIETRSGIWFLDARRPTNHPRALDGWYTPQGLLALLGQDPPQADARLATQPSDYLPLRDYQRDAIAAVEQAIAHGRRDILLALATGTGKTRLALCLIYRLLKAGRFRRILFLVDRTALGEQAHDAFDNVGLENLQSLTQIYDVKKLGDITPGKDTRVHLATIQGMVRRVIHADDDTPPISIDTYDCVIIDECHRGYGLDREMSDTELEYRSEAEYISRYRRVLDHFDAVRIGLTATPALHTTEIFGDPVYTYGYRQAVIDGHLIDHEPPIRIVTRLNQDGIHWERGEDIETYNTATGQIDLIHAPDEIDIDVDGFNLTVLTENFNRVVCEAIAEHIDPSLPGKTLIFCATDPHADTVVTLLKRALTDRYGAIDDEAVMKITGAADKPAEKLRRFKNEPLPRIAVTVDLLTTGVDIPEITNLVFIRRVKSRILFEQMLGRATRLCPAIDKEVFHIYDAVDLYAALERYTDMKPVVARPRLSFTQLVDELVTITDPTHRRAVLDDLTARLQTRKRRITGDRLDAFTTLAGRNPDALIDHLKRATPPEAADWFTAHPQLAPWLDHLPTPGGRDLLISTHEDELLDITRGYGTATRPEDYLTGFGDWLATHRNAIDALLIVTQRPRDLTRQQLRELKLQLDQAGYPERALRTAWTELTNQDIAASIIGFIRQQALGSALVPYDQRVDRALQRVLAAKPWTPPQRKWLERIGKQLKAETIVDREALDRGQFKAEGGFTRLDKVFEGRLEEVLATLHDEVWKDVG